MDKLAGFWRGDVWKMGGSGSGDRPGDDAAESGDFGRANSDAGGRARRTNASKLLDDDDFTDGLTKIIRRTVRDYCTVGKRNGIDC